MIEHPIEITKPHLLMVEGNDDEFFFGALMKDQGLQNIQIINARGASNFGPRLKSIASSPHFKSTVVSMGIVRDADTNPDIAFECVADALKSANLPVPGSTLLPAGDMPRVTVMILPGGEEPGMLEDLCLKSVESDPAMPCVRQYCQCLQQNCPSLPKNTSKAKIQVFMASRRVVGMGLGVAARDGCWRFDYASFDEVKRFIGMISDQ